MNIKIDTLNKTILKCKKCTRLVDFVKKISREKRKQNINETYWGKPVTGFGPLAAKILMIGFLAVIFARKFVHGIGMLQNLLNRVLSPEREILMLILQNL